MHDEPTRAGLAEVRRLRQEGWRFDGCSEAAVALL